MIHETGDAGHVLFNQNLVKGAEPVSISLDVSSMTGITMIGTVVGVPDYDQVTFGNPRTILADTMEINYNNHITLILAIVDQRFWDSENGQHGRFRRVINSLKVKTKIENMVNTSGCGGNSLR